MVIVVMVMIKWMIIMVMITKMMIAAMVMMMIGNTLNDDSRSDTNYENNDSIFLTNARRKQ